jgi:8-oxo-dGTP pyrophosphatase MutT (NUDIX family)
MNSFVVEFPAGLVDEGEALETSAIRELREETYIDK